MNYFVYAGHMLANLFRKPVTTKFPLEAPQYPENDRGKVCNNIDDCIFCGMCQRSCPAGAITVDRTTKTWKINPYACVQCGSCVDNCPKKCLEMQNVYTPAAQEKEDLVLQKILTEAEIRAEEEKKARQKEMAKKAMAARMAKKAAEMKKAAEEKAAAAKSEDNAKKDEAANSEVTAKKAEAADRKSVV